MATGPTDQTATVVPSAQPFDLAPTALGGFARAELGGISVDDGKQASYYVDKSLLICYI